MWILGACAIAAGQTKTPPDADFFPMTRGTYWVYRGRVAWGDEKEATVEWKSEVVESATRGRFKIAVLLGHPWDLPWYEPGRGRGCYLLIADSNTRFYLTQDEGACSIPEGEPGEDLTDYQNLILVMPAKAGDLFGQDPEAPPREDTMYAWSVDKLENAPLAGIKGVAPAIPRTACVLRYSTFPDHQIVTYVPGIGVTAYEYMHHGTVSAVDVKLVEFHASSLP